MFGGVLELLEAFGKRFNAFRPCWELMGAFSRLGRLGSMTPYGMIWYVIKHDYMK